MTCPRCSAELEPGGGACPDCGIQVLRNISGVIKTSAVMISAAGERGFYRSVQEVPEPLRRELLRVTAGDNAGTIVIADRAGKEQLTRGVARREAARGRAAGKPVAGTAAPPAAVPYFLGLSWVVWAGILLLLSSAAVVIAVFSAHR
jgi:hypothetical protein